MTDAKTCPICEREFARAGLLSVELRPPYLLLDGLPQPRGRAAPTQGGLPDHDGQGTLRATRGVLGLVRASRGGPRAAVRRVREVRTVRREPDARLAALEVSRALGVYVEVVEVP